MPQIEKATSKLAIIIQATQVITVSLPDIDTEDSQTFLLSRLDIKFNNKAKKKTITT